MRNFRSLRREIPSHARLRTTRNRLLSFPSSSGEFRRCRQVITSSFSWILVACLTQDPRSWYEMLRNYSLSYEPRSVLNLVNCVRSFVGKEQRPEERDKAATYIAATRGELRVASKSFLQPRLLRRRSYFISILRCLSRFGNPRCM